MQNAEEPRHRKESEPAVERQRLSLEVSLEVAQLRSVPTILSLVLSSSSSFFFFFVLSSSL